MGTTRGIVQYIPALDLCKTYNTKDGVQGFEFFHGSSSFDKEGNLFFGGVNGMNWFHPDQIERNTRRPLTVISFVEIISENKLLQDKPIENSIEIPATANVFSIHFSAMDFTNPKKNTYAYRMYREGSRGGAWIQLGNHRRATFTNIPGGQYIFEVKGANNDGVWSDEFARLRVLVRAPFYKQRWAYYFYAFLLILVVFGLIRYRTNKLIRTNKILREKETAAKVIEKQKYELEIKNKDITDSINYAKRIQEAMMPSREIFHELFSDAFILYKPKSIVSGDFFWINKHEDKIFVAAVDCTGHGVPGAFMSLIGIELFRRITVLKEVEKPAQILELLNENFRKMFDDGHPVSLRDGMDLAFCMIDRKKGIVEYAGAFNPLYVVRNNSILELPAERFSIGLIDENEKKKRFTNHRLVLQKNDVLYLFTDGYADQFGGPYDKKYKKRRFRHLLLNIHQYPLKKQADILDESIENWKGANEQIDDILIIGIRP
jgi:serine phosphatase RsbU (regulator of sigma subunit)